MKSILPALPEPKSELKPEKRDIGRPQDDVVFDTAVDEPFDIQVDDEVDQVSTVTTNEFGLLDEEDDAAFTTVQRIKRIEKKVVSKSKDSIK